MADLHLATGKSELAAQLIGWVDAHREGIINERPNLEQS
jgi:hypothetical protein